MPIYKTIVETAELAKIKTKFKKYTLVNPAEYQDDPAKRKDSMAFCFKLIDGSELVVFTKWRNIITSGVGQEVNYALDKGKKVYELVQKRFQLVTKPVDYKTHQETKEMYKKYWYPLVYSQRPYEYNN